MASFTSRLLPASFRGVPFGVLASDVEVGRRNAVHEYPYRELGWVEDMGRSARRVRVHGFVVGDDAIEKRDKIIKAAETEGDGNLIHPTLGTIRVALVGLQMAERWDLGRVFELWFNFIEQGLRQYPAAPQSAKDAVKVSADDANAKASSAFANRAGDAIQRGDAVLKQAQASASSFGAEAKAQTKSSTTLLHLTDAAGGRSVSIGDLIGTAAVSLQNVDKAAAALRLQAAGLTTANVGGYGGFAQTLTEAVRVASPRPADAIRAMEALVSLGMSVTSDGSPIGLAMAAVQAASRDLFRRAAVVTAALAASDYLPSSNDDAASMRGRVLTLLDAEIVGAGDQGEDEVYQALRDLRAQAAEDLNERGANLPDVVTVHSALPVPSLVLAQRLYRDSARSDELEAEAQAVHPAFMPTVFRALSR